MHLHGPLQPQAIARESFYYRTADEVFHKLSQVKMYPIVDLSMGYYHKELDEARSFLTTFNTPFSRFRFIRIPFGLSVADVFQCKLDAVFSNLDFCRGIADDMII